MTSVGYAQKSKQPLQLTIKSDKQAYFIDERITFLLAVKNLSSKEIQILDPVSGTKLILLILDGKEYKAIGPTTWGGPSAIPPQGEMNIAIDFAEYGITADVLTSDKHNIAVKINETISNTITIQLIPRPVLMYHLDLKFNYDGNKSWWTFKLGDKEFYTLEDMKTYIKTLPIPTGSRIIWTPSDDIIGGEPLHSKSDIESLKKFCEDNGIVLVVARGG